MSIRVAVKGMSAANRTLDGDRARNCEKGRWFSVFEGESGVSSSLLSYYDPYWSA